MRPWLIMLGPALALIGLQAVQAQVMGRAYPGVGCAQQPYVFVPESRLRHMIAYLVTRLRKYQRG
jgi:hypothetical protein